MRRSSSAGEWRGKFRYGRCDFVKRLSELEYGESGFVREIRASQHELNCLGIRRKKQVKMVTRQPIKGPVVVVVDDMEVAMGLEIAEGVIIETDGRGRTGV